MLKKMKKAKKRIISADFTKNSGENISSVIAFACNAKSFAIAFLFFFFSFGRTAERFLANVFRLVTKAVCDQDLTHSVDTPTGISIKIVPQVFIRVTCST